MGVVVNAGMLSGFEQQTNLNAPSDSSRRLTRVLYITAKLETAVLTTCFMTFVLSCAAYRNHPLPVIGSVRTSPLASSSHLFKSLTLPTT